MKERVTIAIDKDLLKLLDMRANIESRTRSNMVEQILKSGLKEITSHGVSARTDKTGG